MEQTISIQTLAVGPIRANCYILSVPGRSDCVVIDPGDEPKRILAAAAGKEVTAVFLTHGHFDHMGGTAGILKKDIPLYIHSLDEPALADPALNMAVLIGQRMTLEVAATPVEEGDVIHAAGMDLCILHTPGHTPGGICIKVGNALFTGDTMFRHGYGRTDLPGGSFQDLYQSMKRLLLLQKDVHVYPGHNEPTTIGVEKERFS